MSKPGDYVTRPQKRGSPAPAPHSQPPGSPPTPHRHRRRHNTPPPPHRPNTVLHGRRPPSFRPARPTHSEHRQGKDKSRTGCSTDSTGQGRPLQKTRQGSTGEGRGSHWQLKGAHVGLGTRILAAQLVKQRRCESFDLDLEVARVQAAGPPAKASRGIDLKAPCVSWFGRICLPSWLVRQACSSRAAPAVSLQFLRFR